MLYGITDIEGGAAPGIYFDLGALVTHKLYGYRGVIVAHDPYCMAGETWYHSNKTQPRKAQPWYHVLVHDSGGLSTYVAQSNLQPDETGEPIEHPRLSCYFADFKDGRYQPKATSGSSGGCGI